MTLQTRKPSTIAPQSWTESKSERVFVMSGTHGFRCRWASLLPILTYKKPLQISPITHATETTIKKHTTHKHYAISTSKPTMDPLRVIEYKYQSTSSRSASLVSATTTDYTDRSAALHIERQADKASAPGSIHLHRQCSPMEYRTYDGSGYRLNTVEKVVVVPRETYRETCTREVYSTREAGGSVVLNLQRRR